MEIAEVVNPKLLNYCLNCTKFKMTSLRKIREAIYPSQWAISFNIKSDYCFIPIVKRNNWSHLSMERHKLTVHDLAILSVSSFKDLHIGSKADLAPLPQVEHNTLPTPG